MTEYNEIILESLTCTMCGDARGDVLFSAKDNLHGLPGEFNIVKCHSCGLMRTSPRPTNKSMESYYPDNYGPYHSTLVERANVPGVLLRTLKFIAAFFFRFNTNNIPNLLPGKMLEIGCASGSFLHKMALKGWEVQGLEFSEKAASQAIKLGYMVDVGALEDMNLPSNCYDMVVGWMVIEHLHDPLGGLKKLYETAKSDSFLVLSLPNAGSFEFRIFKKNWYALQVPTHLHHFTPETIRNMLHKSGWQVDKIYHQRTLSNLIASLGYFLTERGMKFLGEKFIKFPENQGLWPYFLYPLACFFALFGQTGRMTIFARPIK